MTQRITKFRWLRFSIRSLTIAFVFLAVVLALFRQSLQRVYKEREAARYIQQRGGDVYYNEYARSDWMSSIFLPITSAFVHFESGDNLACVKQLPQLDMICFEGGVVDDLSPLKDCPHLNKIMVFGTDLGDLTPLVDCRSLERIYFFDVIVSDLETLGRVKQAKLILFTGTKITNEEAAELAQLLPGCSVGVRESVDDDATWYGHEEPTD
jgi:hypothetical protein